MNGELLVSVACFAVGGSEPETGRLFRLASAHRLLGHDRSARSHLGVQVEAAGVVPRVHAIWTRVIAHWIACVHVMSPTASTGSHSLQLAALKEIWHPLCMCVRM